MDGRFSDIELEWIGERLYQHGRYLSILLGKSIEDKKLIKQRELLGSLNFKVDNYGINPVLHINFRSYGRAIEINYFKNKSQNTISKFSLPNTNSLIWGIHDKKSNKRKDTRWYSHTAYGSLNRLLGIIMYELSENEIIRIKNILELKNNSK